MTTFHKLSDIDSWMDWRLEVIGAVFGSVPDRELIRANREYCLRHLADGTHIPFVCELDGVEAGCGAICLTEEIPSPDNPSGRCAYLMNIYVRPSLRRRGVAGAIVRRLIEEAQTRGCGKIYLETTPMARNLYAAYGFEDMENMMIYANKNN
ncbi:MAG: GNAT family N-acetyltransferase [Muribaculaceae bacterium]|nr:GNAT family N-acetyltransferase [Muribaculaceae bacterium]